MTHLEAGSRDDVISQPAVFGYFTILTEEVGQYTTIQFEGSNFVN